jgi:hypothetical protein
MGDCSRQEAPADSNGKGSEDDDNKGNKESKGNKGKGNKGKGNKGNDRDGNFPMGGGRRWTQQSTRY